jgi:hypothetical protein
MNTGAIIADAFDAVPGWLSDATLRVPGQPDRGVKVKMDVSLEGTSLGTVSARIFRRTCEMHSSRVPDIPDGTRLVVDGVEYDVQPAPERDTGGWWKCGLLPAGMLWRGR